MPRAGTKQQSVERRKHQRLPLAVPVFVRGIDGDGREFLEFATALNISAGGALLAIRRSLPASRILSLEIPVAPMLPADVGMNSIRTLEARLMRVTHGDRHHLYG